MVGGKTMSDEILEGEITSEIIDDDASQLSELDAILAEATDVDGGVIGDDGQVAQSDDSEQIETSELLYPIISTSFDIFASNWKVPDKHKLALAKAYGDLLDKYFPDAGTFFGAELTALTVTGMVVAPHMFKGEPEKEVTTKESTEDATTPSIAPEYSYRPTAAETEGFKLD
jgi:hypothetical protein